MMHDEGTTGNAAQPPRNNKPQEGPIWDVSFKPKSALLQMMRTSGEPDAVPLFICLFEILPEENALPDGFALPSCRRRQISPAVPRK